MKLREQRIALLGLAAAVIGAIGSVIYFFQPWRTCDYDDSPAACSMLPNDAAVMMLFMASFVVGIALVLAGLGIALSRRDPHPNPAPTSRRSN